MRILLVTGKGGVGKTTVSAATAVKAASMGYRTLVTSTDPAHSLADAFQVKLGDQPTLVADRLFAQQIDSQERLEESWGAVRDHLTDLFDWSGLKGVEAEELTVFPGMDEIFALASVRDHARSEMYDLIVVDCAPTAETLRLLSLPEVLSWYMEKIFPMGRRMAKVVRPVVNRVTSMPLIGNDDVFEAVAKFYERLDGIRDILADPLITSARLVMNPEKMVIDEARRTYTYLSLFGFGVDSVVVNRVLPDEVSDPYFARWRTIQKTHLDAVEDAFAEVPRLRLRLFDDEMVGVDRLRDMAHELYGANDPIKDFDAHSPFKVGEKDNEVFFVMSVPFVERSELEVFRHGQELYIQVGPYRRSIVLPDSLQRRSITKATLDGGELRVIFGSPNASASK
jgi:arsenite-transporting ATPase